MDTDQIDLVRDSFVKIVLDTDAAARVFYGRLFELAPETRSMFRIDMAEQGRHLIETLGRIVTGLSKLDAMRPALGKLARRHVDYGVEDRHYAFAGDALMRMVTVHGGPPIDNATIEAWKAAYALIEEVMIAASNDYRGLRSST